MEEHNGRAGAQVIVRKHHAPVFTALEERLRVVDPPSGRLRILRDCPLGTGAPVTYTDCNVSSARYSPDGQKIAFPSTQIVPDFTGQPWQVSSIDWQALPRR